MLNTTPTEKKAAERATRRLVAGLAATAVLILVAAALPLLARLIQLPGEGTRQAIFENREVPEKELIGVMKSWMNALAWHETGKTLDDLAMTAAAHARLAREENEDLAEKALLQAWQWEKESLARAPANAYGWTRLAHILLQTEGASPAAARALSRSLETQPFEPALLMTRLGMMALLFDKLDTETKIGIPAMIRAAWKHLPYELAHTARQNHFVSMVERALTEDPAELKSFRKVLEESEQNDEKEDESGE